MATKVERAYKEEYADILNYVSIRSGYSLNKVRTTLNHFTTSIQRALKRGYDIHIPNLVHVTFTTKGYDVLYNTVYSFNKHVEDVMDETGYRKDEVARITSIYYQRLKELSDKGYRVNIQGICYIEPYETSDGKIDVKVRLSPINEKPEVGEFLIRYQPKKKTEEAVDIVTTLTQDELRFKIRLAKDYVLPESINYQGEDTLELDYIDI